MSESTTQAGRDNHGRSVWGNSNASTAFPRGTASIVDLPGAGAVRQPMQPNTATSELYRHYAEDAGNMSTCIPAPQFGGFGGGGFGGAGASGSWQEVGPAKKTPGKTLKLQFMAFIPARLGSILSSAKPGKRRGLVNQKQYDAEVKAVPGFWAEEPLNAFSDYCFRTDDRDFGGGSHRLVSEASINTSDLGDWSAASPFASKTGESERVWSDVSGFFSKEGHIKREKKRASATGESKVVSNTKNTTVFQASAAAAYPFVFGSPSIDLSGVWTLSKTGADGSQIKVALHGRHNDFPCYEVLVNGSSLYKFNTTGSGPGLWNLGFASTKFNADGTF